MMHYIFSFFSMLYRGCSNQIPGCVLQENTPCIQQNMHWQCFPLSQAVRLSCTDYGLKQRWCFLVVYNLVRYFISTDIYLQCLWQKCNVIKWTITAAGTIILEIRPFYIYLRRMIWDLNISGHNNTRLDFYTCIWYSKKCHFNF